MIVGAGDLTGDGLADIVARTGDGKLYQYEGTGNSTSPFDSRLHVGPGWQQFKSIAAPGGINGDSRADLLATNSCGELFRYESNGSGGFNSVKRLRLEHLQRPVTDLPGWCGEGEQAHRR